MKIKKYIGKTAHEAMLKLKMELGPDSVILNTKTIRAKGILRYFKKPLIEITAAFEDKDLLKNNDLNNYDHRLNNINEELIELKNIMKDFPTTKHEDFNFTPTLNKFHNTMVSNGIDPKISMDILTKIGEEINLKDKDINTIKNIIKFNLSEIIGNPQPIAINVSRKIIFFIGPTGVGKTTTLAKIASNLVLQNQYNIGLITSDTYRIAAVEQLKIYSDILQLPLEIVYNKDDMNKALNHFKDMDIVFVDTAGRNHNNYEQIEELKDIINTTNNKEIFLLINATMDFRVLKSLIAKYDFLDDFKLIVTKIDEAENYGSLLNIKYLTDKELSYYTTGQNVPDDIKIINIEDIVAKLIEENTYD